MHRVGWVSRYGGYVRAEGDRRQTRHREKEGKLHFAIRAPLSPVRNTGIGSTAVELTLPYLGMQERKADAGRCQGLDLSSLSKPWAALTAAAIGGRQEWFSIRMMGGHVAALPRQTAVL